MVSIKHFFQKHKKSFWCQIFERYAVDTVWDIFATFKGITMTL